MQKIILKELNLVKPMDIVNTRKVLGKLYTHISFYLKRNNKRVLLSTAKTIEEFLSANKSKFDKEKNDNYNSIYRIKLFTNELIYFIELCKTGAK